VHNSVPQAQLRATFVKVLRNNIDDITLTQLYDRVAVEQFDEFSSISNTDYVNSWMNTMGAGGDLI
jgi:hypothetical protein